MTETVKSVDEMKSFAEKFISGLEPRTDRATVAGLYGELGAGKTTFTQSVAELLGVADIVTSPTFTIMKVYELPNLKFKISNLKFSRLIHIDAYRLEKSSELTHLGWDNLISDPENLILIEWPERVVGVMPEHTEIRFKHISESEREVEVTGRQ